VQFSYTLVYDLVKQIPCGKVATYGQIATMSGNPRRARIVGHALSLCNQRDVPCHRVVNFAGGLSDGFSPLGKETHRMLLQMEGVLFLDNGCVDLEHCLWR